MSKFDICLIILLWTSVGVGSFVAIKLMSKPKQEIRHGICVRMHNGQTFNNVNFPECETLDDVRTWLNSAKDLITMGSKIVNKNDIICITKE